MNLRVSVGVYLRTKILSLQTTALGAPSTSLVILLLRLRGPFGLIMWEQRFGRRESSQTDVSAEMANASPDAPCKGRVASSRMTKAPDLSPGVP